MHVRRRRDPVEVDHVFFALDAAARCVLLLPVVRVPVMAVASLVVVAGSEWCESGRRVITSAGFVTWVSSLGVIMAGVVPGALAVR